MKALVIIGVCVLAALGGAGPGALAQTAAVAPQVSLPAPAAGMHPAVARIVAPSEGSVSYGSGTLVYLGDNYGLVVTNWHVINEATGPISVHFPDGFYSLGSVQKVDRDWDLALIAIRKPNAQPVSLADSAPRPGEMLTIAGYGSGTYRAASGPCTQYVAPGTTFPYEMVEVAVSARQGDSGGPIFNARGELAGVLFGEGQGRTSGSYCGRVRWFLTSVAPVAAPPPQAVVQVPLKPVAPRPVVAAADAEPYRIASAPVVQTVARPLRATSSDLAPPTAAVPAPLGAAGAQVPPMQTLGWEDVAGETFGEQLKTILAGVGVLALVLHTLRWLGSERAPG